MVVPLGSNYSDVELLVDGMLRVEIDDRYGLINIRGDVVLPYEYDNIGYWFDNYFAIEQNCYIGVADNNGKIIIPCAFDLIDYIDDELVIAKQGDRSAIYNLRDIEHSGKFYDYISEFDDGIATVKLNGLFGFISSSGECRKFPVIHDFSLT